MSELKLCPFCGAEPEIYPADWTNVRWVAICGNPDCVSRDEGEYHSEKLAVTAWNKRYEATP